jgi:hypothetical protein
VNFDFLVALLSVFIYPLLVKSGRSSRRSFRSALFIGVLAGSVFSGSGAFADPLTQETFYSTISADLSGAYLLGEDIDISRAVRTVDEFGEIVESAPTNSTVFGTFSGTLNGANNRIYGLTTPLFNVIDGEVGTLTVKNLVLNADQVSGIIGNGALSNQALAGSTFENIHVNGNVNGTDYVGGLIGLAESDATISKSSVTGNITASGSYVGGLVGSAAGEISESFFSGGVTGNANNIGGLVGSTSGSISDSYVNVIGSVSGSGQYVGGLVGSTSGSVSNSYANINGDVSGGGVYVGGLIGYSTATVSNSYANVNGDVTGGAEYVGGFIGRATENVSNSYAIVSGDVTGDGYSVGGFMGHTVADVSNSYSNVAGDVFGGDTIVGGFIGSATGSITNSHATVGRDVVGNQGYIGGFIGSSSGEITNSHATIGRDVIGKQNNVGGFAGAASTVIRNSGATIGRDLRGGYEEPLGTYNFGNYVGGLVGYFAQGDTFDSYVSIGRDLIGGNTVGGLMGISEHSPPTRREIRNTVVEIGRNLIATGDYIGGLIGLSSYTYLNNLDVTIHGNLNTSVLNSQYVGGLVGYHAFSKTENADGLIKGDIIAKNRIGRLTAWSSSRESFGDDITGSYLVLNGEVVSAEDANLVSTTIAENYLSVTQVIGSDSMIWEIQIFPTTPTVLVTINTVTAPSTPQFNFNACQNNGKPIISALSLSYIRTCSGEVDSTGPVSRREKFSRIETESRFVEKIEKTLGFKMESSLQKSALISFVETTEKIDLAKVKAVDIAPTANVRVTAKAGEALQISLKSESKDPVELWVKSPDGSWLLAGVITFDKDGKAILPPLQFKNAGDYSLVLSKPTADSAKGSAPLNQTGSLLVAVS